VLFRSLTCHHSEPHRSSKANASPSSTDQIMEGFRYYYESSLRVEDNIDWSVHSVDYGLFKKRLMFFSERRIRLRRLLRNSTDGLLPENIVVGIVGPVGQTILDIPSPGSYIPLADSSGSSQSTTQNPEISQADAFTGMMRGHLDKRLKLKAIMRRLSNSERNEVTLFLSYELEKVVMFYHAQWSHLTQIFTEMGPSEYLANEILELLSFCTTNILAIRQILIRYDAFVRNYGGTPMLQWYMKKVLKPNNPNPFRKLLHHEELKALIDSLEREYTGPLMEFGARKQLFLESLDRSRQAEFMAKNGSAFWKDSILQTMQDVILLSIGMMEDTRMGLEPTFMKMRGASLTDDMQQISDWRKGRNLILSPPEPKPTLSFKQRFALGLNLVSGFFYCMNYYIVEPSSTSYVNALGCSDAMSGLLIGMMPLAALASAMAYSIWTNTSFRSPLLVSSMLLVAGNLVYSSAYKHGSIGFALAGRFMTGLGAPKCIIRRYMADTTPVALRTSVNAAFGMAIAVGSAMGPAAAIFVSDWNRIYRLPFFGSIIVNSMTGPGYLMAMIWTVYTIVVFITFVEPSRAGLEEQKILEMKKKGKFVDEGDGLMIDKAPSRMRGYDRQQREDDLSTVFSGEVDESANSEREFLDKSWSIQIKECLGHLNSSVKLCLGLLFAKTFTIEALVSCTSALTKNRYNWHIEQVGIMGCVNGLLVIPFSIGVGYLSMMYQDRVLMTYLVSIGAFGYFLLIDWTDLRATPSDTYNQGVMFSVGPPRYVLGYFIAYVSIQSFEGVIGSTLSKVIPTALASGTINSGLLATMVDTLGRASGDIFISIMGYINLRQLMNLLFIPTFTVLISCLVMIRRNYDMLAV